MTLVLNDFTVMANAMYAENKTHIDYKDVEDYKKLLYRMLVDRYRYILLNFREDNAFEHEGVYYVKASDGIRALTELKEEYIEAINSIYPIDYQNIIRESREEYKSSRQRQ